MTYPAQQRDISDNASRGAVLTRLITAASMDAPGELPPWSAPMEKAQFPTQSSSPGLGVAWHMSNVLSAMNQHIRNLCVAALDSPFLTGSPATCVDGLTWFARFAASTSPMPLEQYDQLNQLIAHCAAQQGTTPQRAAFDMHRSVARPHRHLTQLLVEQHFPGPHKEFELDVCGYMLANPNLTYAQWTDHFPAWRQAGLYYPLAIAAVYMPNLEQWLPSHLLETPFAFYLGDCIAGLRSYQTCHYTCIAQLSVAWKADTSEASLVAGSILDRLAVLMGVKSNGRPGEGNFDLERTLACFASEFQPLGDGEGTHAHNYRCWFMLKAGLEAAFPPSVLCAPLVRPKKSTWGYKALTLDVAAGPVAFFSENNLQALADGVTGPGCAHAYTPAHSKCHASAQTSQRIQEILWRLGEIATSPQVSACMTVPHLSVHALKGTVNGAISDCGMATHLGASAFHQQLALTAGADRDQNYVHYTTTMDSLLPPPRYHLYPAPQTILLWRLDTPPRAIIYLGDGSDVLPSAPSQQHLPKLLINAKTKTRRVGGIHSCAGEASEETVRNCIKAFASKHLWTHPENTVLYTQSAVKQESGQVMPLTCTTLAESVACFALHVPEEITVCDLGQSCAWKENGIDPRYAEMQIAANGFRLRDWAAMHIGKGGTQQSRLAAHVVRFDALHTLAMPWTDQENVTRWVSVSSTLSPDNRTLHGATLRRAVENRFIHDVKMLPSVDHGRIEKSNCEIYTDAIGSVCVVYAVNGDDHLHFMSFQLFPEPM